LDTHPLSPPDSSLFIPSFYWPLSLKLLLKLPAFFSDRDLKKGIKGGLVRKLVPPVETYPCSAAAWPHIAVDGVAADASVISKLLTRRHTG